MNPQNDIDDESPQNKANCFNTPKIILRYVIFLQLNCMDVQFT